MNLVDRESAKQTDHSSPTPPRHSAAPDSTATDLFAPSKSAVYLPSEIILSILSFVPLLAAWQPSLYSLCLVSRQWYAVAVTRLYHSPHITGENFSKFMATVCPTVNAHVRRSELAEYIRRLDMGLLVYEGSKSMTARLLGRVKTGLEDFVAPQASFAVNSLAALSKCRRLRHLDLSLVSKSLTLAELLPAIEPLTNLVSLRLFHSTYNRGRTLAAYSWPENLKAFHMSGSFATDALSVLEHTLRHSAKLSHLAISHCSISDLDVYSLVDAVKEHLTHFKMSHPMNSVSPYSLDSILEVAPNLRSLSLQIEFITERAFWVAPDPSAPDDREPTSDPSRKYRLFPLQELELDSSGMLDGAWGGTDLSLARSAEQDTLSPGIVYHAVTEGSLGCLRRVRVSKRLGWDQSEGLLEEAQELGDLLEELGRADVESGLPKVECGVWIFD